jgi:hypothetical protein
MKHLFKFGLSPEVSLTGIIALLGVDMFRPDLIDPELRYPLYILGPSLALLHILRRHLETLYGNQ